MSMYGPPGGPYPGQPQDPWQGGQQPDPYGQSAQYDPGHPPPTYDQPAYGQQPGPGGAVWGEPVAPPPKKGSGLLIAIVAVLALLVCGGGATVAYLVVKSDSKKVVTTTGASPATSPATSPSTSPASTSSPAATSSPAGTSAADGGRNIKAGDCVVNDGTNDVPKLRKATCGSRTYQVLQRFDGTSDKEKCRNVTGSNASFFYDSTLNSLDYVLCMKQR